MERINIKRILAGLVLALFAWPALTGQGLIFEKQVGPFPEHPDFGPNRKHFIHPVLQFRAGIPPGLLSKGKPVFPSAGLAGGFRYKMKINPILAIGAESGLSYDHLRRFRPDVSGQSDSLARSRESFRSTGAFATGFVRIKTNKCGDYLGRFIDIGIIVTSPFLTNLVSRVYEFHDGNLMIPSEIVKRQRIDSMPTGELGGFLRVGNNKAALTVLYRQTQIFPNLTIGFGYAVMGY